MGHLHMRRLLPSRVELAIFATLAVVCAGVVGTIQPGKTDLGFAFFAAPIFLFAAVMGLRRSPTWQIVEEVVEDATAGDESVE